MIDITLRFVLVKLVIIIFSRESENILLPHEMKADTEPGNELEDTDHVNDVVPEQSQSGRATGPRKRAAQNDQGQELAAQYFFRPRNSQAAAKYAAQFPKIKLFTIGDVFGGWAKAQKTHFVNGAIFDQIYSEKN